MYKKLIFHCVLIPVPQMDLTVNHTSAAESHRMYLSLSSHLLCVSTHVHPQQHAKAF